MCQCYFFTNFVYFFARCPSHKTGAECQQKILSVRSVGPEVDEGKDGNKGSETDFIIRVAVFSLACTLSVIIMAVFVWKRYIFRLFVLLLKIDKFLTLSCLVFRTLLPIMT